MIQFIKRLHWADYLILAVLIGLFGFVWYRVSDVLNYTWNWGIIPQFTVYWEEETNSWHPNLLLIGLFATIRVCIYASILAMIFGTVLGLGRCAKNLTLRMLSRTYLEFLRNIPPVVILFIFFFFLSDQLMSALHVEGWARRIARGDNAEIWAFFFGDMRYFPSLMSGVVVLALFESAFVGEIVRAGIQSIERGQREAAQSIGLNWMDTMRFIVLPQAVRNMLPPLANQFIALIKHSSIVSLISVQELTFKTMEVVSGTRAIFEAWLTTAAVYFILCFGLSLLFRRLERRPER
ncbi:MAG: amino acid ABC transporter permease [Alphaproteobacteria bacterium]|nr:amino acid ABC transporter permease [Alphaproteobacteria bacterium]